MITLTLPYPPDELSPNKRVPWQKKAPITKRYRYGIAMQAIKQVRELPTIPVLPLKTPVTAEITFIVKNLQRDADNCLASFKAGIDGLVDAKILKSDGSRYFNPGKPIVLKGERDEVQVVLRGAE